jgi:hypothetical protein
MVEFIMDDLYGRNAFGEIEEPIAYLLEKKVAQDAPGKVGDYATAVKKQTTDLNKLVKSKYNIMKNGESQEMKGTMKFQFKR